MTIPTNQQCRTDSDGSSQSSHRAWMTWTCRPIFNFLATMAVVNHTEDGNDANYSPQSPEPSEPSSILTPPKNISNFDSWETSYTTTDDNAFYSSDEPRRIYFLPPSPSSPPSPPRKMKRKLARWKSYPKRGAVLQHVCEACGQTSKGHSRSISN